MPVAPAPLTIRRDYELGIGLGIRFIAILFALLLAVIATGFKWVPTRPGQGDVLTGLFTTALGCMFLAAYYYSHKSFFLRALMCICETFSRPAHRKMAFFYFALSVGVGGIVMVHGLGLM